MRARRRRGTGCRRPPSRVPRPASRGCPVGRPAGPAADTKARATLLHSAVPDSGTSGRESAWRLRSARLVARVADLPRRRRPSGPAGPAGADRRRTGQLRRPARRHPRARQPDPGRRCHRSRAHRQPAQGRQRDAARRRRAVPDPGGGAGRGARGRRRPLRGPADPGGEPSERPDPADRRRRWPPRSPPRRCRRSRSPRRAWTRSRATDGEYHAFLHVAAEQALAAAADVDEAVAAGEAAAVGRWPASRWRSRTSSPPPTCRPPAGRRSSRAGRRRTTPP